jgi:predicted Fe-Mo cluster-binding NifX family protein
MKIAVALTERTVGSDVDPRFGRCSCFLIYDTEAETRILLDNPGIHATGGAGTQVTQWLADQSVEVVIASEFGPKAQRALISGGLNAYLVGGGTGEQAIEAYLEGRLKPASGSLGRGRGRGRGRRDV